MSNSELWQKEFEDYLKVLEFGANKYTPNGWLEPNGARTSFKEYHDSMFHHLAKSFSGVRIDDESGLDHLLHLITNAQMLYTRIKRNIHNDKDVTLTKKNYTHLWGVSNTDVEIDLSKPIDTYLCSEWYGDISTDIFNHFNYLDDDNEPQYKGVEKRFSDREDEDKDK